MRRNTNPELYAEWEGAGSNTARNAAESVANQAKKMSKNQIDDLFGNKSWHSNGTKNKIAKDYSKELKGSKNFDFYRAKNGDIYIQGNKSGQRIKIDITRNQ